MRSMRIPAPITMAPCSKALRVNFPKRALCVMSLLGMHIMHDDMVKNMEVAEGEKLHQVIFGRLSQSLIRCGVEYLAGKLASSHPFFIFSPAACSGNKCHFRKASPAEIGGDASKFSFGIGDQVELGTHSRHGENLTAELGNPKRIHRSIG